MAITYPLSLPTSIGIAQIELRAVNAIGLSQSPFTFAQQTVIHQGQRWEASVSIPTLRREYTAPWKAFLTALKGRRGTFLLSDPDYVSPRGTATSATIEGTAGNETATITMTGTLLAGDYIQIGTLLNSRLYQVLEDCSDTGVGTTISLWPALRSSPEVEVVNLSSPSGLFRLADNQTSWAIDSSSAYSISFDCMEVI
jgi:hypothetical protein